jgi:hypothetical protein
MSILRGRSPRCPTEVACRPPRGGGRKHGKKKLGGEGVEKVWEEETRRENPTKVVLSSYSLYVIVLPGKNEQE